MRNIKNGVYVKQGKFADYGSIPEDSIYYHTRLAERADAERMARIERSKLRLRRAKIL
jgi:hypothetical protein